MRDDLKKAWWKWHKENPQVWELFQKYTFQLINAGFSHYGAKGVMERIRWHSDVETTGDRFKIGNNHTAYYARYFHHKYPEYDGFFRTRNNG